MKMIGKIAAWIVSVLVILTGLLLLIDSLVAGILWIGAGILALPPVRKKIPEFKYRKAVLPVCCIFMLLAGIGLIPGIDEPVQETAKNQTNSKESSNEEKETKKERKEQETEEIKESDNKKETDKKKKEENDTFQETDLLKWITDTLYGEHSEEETLEIADSDKETWSKVSEDDFLPAWKKAVLSQLDTRNGEYDLIKSDLERAVSLYQSVRKSTDPISSIQQNLDALSQAILANTEIEKKYSFDFMNAYESYKTGDFYISGIIETAYDDNVAGKIQKEIDSYSEQETTNWQAYNVEYILDSPIPGDNDMIIQADSTFKFPKSGVYTLAYFDTGDTTKIIRAGGFEEYVPLLYLIEDGSQFSEDANTYAYNQTTCSDSFQNIRQELGETASSRQQTEGGATSRVMLADSYSRSIGPKCSMAIWSTDEKGISFSICIGSSGYKAYVDIRNCTAEWTGDNTAVYTDTYGDRNYTLTFSLAEDHLTLSENVPFDENFSLAGDYIADNTAEDHCEFVFPEDNVFPIEASALEGKTAAECKIARNEIYARHGRRFHDEQLQGYFDVCSWYEGTINPEEFSDDVLSEVEKSNLQMIADYEAKMGF